MDTKSASSPRRFVRIGVSTIRCGNGSRRRSTRLLTTRDRQEPRSSPAAVITGFTSATIESCTPSTTLSAWSLSHGSRADAMCTVARYPHPSLALFGELVDARADGGATWRTTRVSRVRHDLGNPAAHHHRPRTWRGPGLLISDNLIPCAGSPQQTRLVGSPNCSTRTCCRAN